MFKHIDDNYHGQYLAIDIHYNHKKDNNASDFGPAGQHRSAPAASGTKCDEEVDPGPFRGRRDGRWIWFTGCFFPTKKRC